MSVIGQRVFAVGGNQLYMTLANEEYVRPLGIGTNWSRLRIGVLMAMTPDSTNNLSSMTFTMGICSGTANPYGAALTTNWAGVSVFSTAGGMTYTANAGNPYFTNGTPGQGAKKVGAALTTANVGVNTNIPTNGGAIQRKVPIMAEVIKGSPNYTFALVSPPSGAMTTDFSFGYFIDAMEQTSVNPVANGQTFNGATGAGIAVTEVTGVFDTLDIYWNKAAYPVEIYGIAVYRFS